MNATTYNAYIDNRLAAIDTMDNQVRAEFGSDYTFLFQYFYPRVAELKKSEDKTTSLLSQITSVFGGSDTPTVTPTTPVVTPTVTPTTPVVTPTVTPTTPGATGATGNCNIEVTAYPKNSDGTLNYT